MGISVVLAHACNNGACSNPCHLYWGTQGENVDDAIKCGAILDPWKYSVIKYGLEKAKERNKKSCNPSLMGAGNKNKPKSDSHKRNLSESLKKYHAQRIEQAQRQGILFP